MRDLAKARLLLPLQDNPLYGHITRAFAEADSVLRSGLEVGSSALVQEMARAQVGVALIPATAAADVTKHSDDRSSTVIRPIEGMAPRNVALTMNARSQPSRAALAIATIIEKIAHNAVATMPGCRPTATGRGTEPRLEAPQPPPDVISIRDEV